MKINEDFKRSVVGFKIENVVLDDYGGVEIKLSNGNTINYFHSENDASLFVIDENGREIKI